jgi:hypothetical protein
VIVGDSRQGRDGGLVELEQDESRIDVCRDRRPAEGGSSRRDDHSHRCDPVGGVMPGEFPGAHQAQRIPGIGPGGAKGATTRHGRRTAEVTGAVRRPSLRGRRMRGVPRQILDSEPDVGLLAHKAS